MKLKLRRRGVLAALLPLVLSVQPAAIRARDIISEYPTETDGLEEDMQQLLTLISADGETVRIGIAIRDLADGTSWSWQGDEYFIGASTYKLPLAMVYYDSLRAEQQMAEVKAASETMQAEKAALKAESSRKELETSLSATAQILQRELAAADPQSQEEAEAVLQKARTEVLSQLAAQPLVQLQENSTIVQENLTKQAHDRKTAREKKTDRKKEAEKKAEETVRIEKEPTASQPVQIEITFDTQTEQDLHDAILYSDNDAAYRLYENLGGWDVFRYKAGAYSEYKPGELALTRDNLWQPDYMLDVLERLYEKQEYYPELMDNLRNAQPTDYLNRVEQLEMAQKYGYYEGAVNAVGISTQGHPYAIAVYSWNLPEAEIWLGRINASANAWFNRESPSTDQLLQFADESQDVLENTQLP